MVPSDFKEKTLALKPPPGMANCGDLAIYRDLGERCTISRWNPSWRERVMFLLGAPVWLRVYWDGMTQPPVSLEIVDSVFTQPAPVGIRARINAWLWAKLRG